MTFGKLLITYSRGCAVRGRRRRPPVFERVRAWSRGVWPGSSAGIGLLFLAGLAAVGCGETGTGSSPQTPARTDFAEVADELAEMIEREQEQKGLAAVSIALVDSGGVVWADGFGEQSEGIPATAETVYRVGSVSKLFTDIAVMQLAERGEIDIDAPVRGYLPDFAPDNRSGTAITLRQLMSHRSGLIREPPAGHYFDDTGTGLAATIASLNGTPLVYEPETRPKYSNAGIAVVGYALEVTQGEPFADYVKSAVIEPLGMTGSAFEPEPGIVDDLAQAYMWGFDRPDFDAPGFELGMAPAGSMYSTVLDLARFMGVMFRRGALEDGGAEDSPSTRAETPGATEADGTATRLLAPETLEAMWTPQFAEPGATTGYGLGFAVQERFGERWLGHGGAIYGFSTQLAFLPDAQLGVVVVSAVDGTNTFTSRVADAALQLMLAARTGQPLPEAPLRGSDPIPPALTLALEGTYGAGDRALDLDHRGGRLFMTPARGGATVEIRSRGDTLIVDDRASFGARYLPDGATAPTALVPLGPDGNPGDLLPRQPPAPLPPPPPPHWNGLIGEYGWDHNVLYILERGWTPARAHRVVLPVPAHRDLARRVRLPRMGALPRRAPRVRAGCGPGRSGPGHVRPGNPGRHDSGPCHLGRRRLRPLPPARRRHRGRRHLPDRPRPPRRGAPRRSARRFPATRTRPLPRLRTRRGRLAGARHSPRCALRDHQQLHVVGLLRRAARLPAAPRGRGGRARPPRPSPSTATASSSTTDTGPGTSRRCSSTPPPSRRSSSWPTRRTVRATTAARRST